MEKQLDKLKEGLKDKVKSMETKIEESERQNVFLNDQMGNVKIAGDLQKIKDGMWIRSEQLSWQYTIRTGVYQGRSSKQRRGEIMEASFNNELNYFEENHWEEVFILKETIARQTSEFNSNMDEKEIVVMDLVVNIKTLEKKHANSGIYYQKKQAAWQRYGWKCHKKIIRSNWT